MYLDQFLFKYKLPKLNTSQAVILVVMYIMIQIEQFTELMQANIYLEKSLKSAA